MIMINWQDKRFLVVGLGRTGLSVLAFLYQYGVSVAVYDEQLSTTTRDKLEEQYQQLNYFSGSLKEVLLAYPFDILVLSPGVSRKQTAVIAFEQSGGLVIGDIELLAWLLAEQDTKIIAITGSNGKTTVTSLVGYLCQCCGLDTVVAGNIGLPVLEAYQQRAGKVADVWVLELSSFQLETTRSLNASAATVLNISEDHLDRYDNLLEYAYAKSQVFRGDGVQVLNADDVLCCAMKHEGRKVRWFSLAQTKDYYFNYENHCLQQGKQYLIDTKSISLQGRHNMGNILAALALCESIGLKRERLVPFIPQFKGLPHRVERVGEKNGVLFIDDSKGTNVGATVAAVSGFNQPLLLILGGVGKGQDFTPLKAVIKDKVRAVFLIGEDADKIQQDLADSGVLLIDCSTLPEAVNQAYHMAEHGDIVLLSPACASFDMFRDYAHRAEIFIEAFHAL